ncbi:hypothetical protein L1887_18158 [Cichorium endivia]|nr:hypothetical protein L1887_18158 [Cichorium endivia]
MAKNSYMAKVIDIGNLNYVLEVLVVASYMPTDCIVAEAMAVAAETVIVPLDVMFFVSDLIFNLIQVYHSLPICLFT